MSLRRIVPPYLITSIGSTERLRCQRAENMINTAIKNSQIFTDQQLKNIRVFPQGSYANNTNISGESDVDIAVCYLGSFYTDFNHTPGLNNEMLRYSPAIYTFLEFRDDLIKSLVNYFGKESITIGNKSIKISGNSYRVKIDVVPCFPVICYLPNALHFTGIRFVSSDGEVITNFPDQHHLNGSEKNKETNYRFKRVVRDLKQINADLSEDVRVPSFLIESLIWNVPTDLFIKTPEVVVLFLGKQLQNPDYVSEMLEINGIKSLFDEKQPWTPRDAMQFVYYAGRRLQLW